MGRGGFGVGSTPLAGVESHELFKLGKFGLLLVFYFVEIDIFV